MNDDENAPHKTQAVLLFSDDDADDLLFCEKALRREGIDADFRVVCANEDVFRWLQGEPPYNNRKNFPVPDALIVDLHCGHLDGRELLRWIRKDPRFDGLPVIIHTGKPQPGHKEECIQIGANDYVVKHPECVELMQCVARILDHRR